MATEPAAATATVTAAGAIPRSQVDLLDFIDWSGVECLNQNTGHSLVNALKQGYREDEGLYLESDADEQLLIYIPFKQVIKLHSVVIRGPEEEEGSVALSRREIVVSWEAFSSNLQALWLRPGRGNFVLRTTCSTRPRMVKFFANKEHMGFSNVNDFPASDSVALSADNLTGKPFILKYVKFQNVRSLTIFIEDNQCGTDTTKIEKLVLYGTTVIWTIHFADGCFLSMDQSFSGINPDMKGINLLFTDIAGSSNTDSCNHCFEV